MLHLRSAPSSATRLPPCAHFSLSDRRWTLSCSNASCTYPLRWQFCDFMVEYTRYMKENVFIDQVRAPQTMRVTRPMCAGAKGMHLLVRLPLAD